MSRSNQSSLNGAFTADSIRGKRRWARQVFALALALGLMALGLFVGIVWGVKTDGIVKDMDMSILTTLHSHAVAKPAAVSACKVITEFASPYGQGVVVVIGIVFFTIRRQFLLLTAWLIVESGAVLLGIVLKEFVHRDRPQFVDALAHANSASFPSGHALLAIVCYGFIAYLLLFALPPSIRRHALIAMLVLLILAIGFTRLYLGLHFASDVLAGYTAGAAWLAFSICCMEIVRQRRSPAMIGS